jgi:FixJ family two-component response regulator
MSGYTDDAMLERETLSGDRGFIQKPFYTNVLASKVRKILDRVTE